LEILIYNKGYHPSSFRAKIVIDKRTGKQQDADWTTYERTIMAKKAPLYLNDTYPFPELGETYHTIKCEIRCDKKMQKAIQKNGLVGTINIFYGNGKGDGISFY
jgi:hypothetical protein